jgi:FKBP-type peptidyl-prolyl cis-trans isomerase
MGNDCPCCWRRCTNSNVVRYFSSNNNNNDSIENDMDDPVNLKKEPQQEKKEKAERPSAQRMVWVTLGTYLAVRMAGEHTSSLRTFLKPHELEWVLEGFCDTMRQKEKTAIEILDAIDPRHIQTANAIQQRIQNEMRIRIETKGKEYCQAFRRENNNVQTTASGLLYRIDTPGIGPIPTIQDLVEVHYHGILVADGTVMDSTLLRGASSSSPQTRIFPVAAVMDGWKEALALLKVGGKGRFVIPPHLAYGNEGSPIVPPGSTLQYDIELVRIVSSEQTTTITTTTKAQSPPNM